MGSVIRNNSFRWLIVGAVLIIVLSVSIIINKVNRDESSKIHYVKNANQIGPGILSMKDSTLANIHLGDSQEKVIQMMGDPDETGVLHGTPYPYFIYNKQSVTVAFYKAGSSPQEPVGGVVEVTINGDSGFQTDKGIGIGASLNDIIKAYGDVYVNSDKSNVWINGIESKEVNRIKYYPPQLQMLLLDGKIVRIEMVNVPL